MRYIKGDFVVIGPDIQPTRFKTPNRDSGTGPAQARCAIGCHCKIKLLDAGEMLKDVLAVIVPHIDSMRESLSVLALPSTSVSRPTSISITFHENRHLFAVERGKNTSSAASSRARVPGGPAIKSGRSRRFPAIRSISLHD